MRWRNLPRSVTRHRDAGVPSPRRDPWRTSCLLPTWKTTNNVSNVPGRSFTSASGSGARSTAGHRKAWPGPSRPSGPGPDAATLEVVSPAGRSTRTVERQVTCYRLDLLGGDDITSAVRARRRRRQPHVDRKARQATRAPSRSRLPPRGMHRRKMSADQPLVAHRLPSLTFQIRRSPTTLCSAG